MTHIKRIDEYNNTNWSQAENRYEHDTFFDEDTEEYKDLLTQVRNYTRLPKAKCRPVIDAVLSFWGKKHEEYEKITGTVKNSDDLIKIVCDDLKVELKDFCKPELLEEMCDSIASYLVMNC